MIGLVKRVCRWCKEKGDMETMVSEKQGKQNKFYHQSCYEDYVADKEFKRVQVVLKQSLHDKVADIYKIPIDMLPKDYFSYIENIRNGEPAFKGHKPSTKYKEGYEYTIIEKTYDYCRKDIEYWNEAKDFDSIGTAIRYGLRIILDKINYVNRQEQRYGAEDSVTAKKANGFKENFESTYKKVDRETDISDFLDD